MYAVIIDTRREIKRKRERENILIFLSLPTPLAPFFFSSLSPVLFFLHTWRWGFTLSIFFFCASYHDIHTICFLKILFLFFFFFFKLHASTQSPFSIMVESPPPPTLFSSLASETRGGRVGEKEEGGRILGGGDGEWGRFMFLLPKGE